VTLWGLLGGIVMSPLVLHVARAAARRGPPGRLIGGGVVLACAVGGMAAASLTEPALIVAYGLAVAVTVAAAAVDASEKRLPNVLTYPLAGGGLLTLTALSVLTGSGSPWRALAGCGMYGGWLFIASLTGLGPGDVKLAAGVGIWLGWYSWPMLLTGMAFGQILITTCYLAGRRRQLAGSGTRGTPLGPAITAGFIAALLLVV
jgi:leader peptidase (prepilin peptidase)/N-methyltransferase